VRATGCFALGCHRRPRRLADSARTHARRAFSSTASYHGFGEICAASTATSPQPHHHHLPCVHRLLHLPLYRHHPIATDSFAASAGAASAITTTPASPPACTRPVCLPCLTRACAEHTRTVLPSVDEPRRRDAKAGCAPLARPISLTPPAPRGHSHACGGPRSTPALAPPLRPPRHVVAVGALPYRKHPNSQPDPCRGSRGKPRECAAAAAVPRLGARPAHPGASAAAG